MPSLRLRLGIRAPQATLFNDDDKQIITHFLSPNPDESDTPRATWQRPGHQHRLGRSDRELLRPRLVAPGAIPWLLLQVVGAQVGPTGGDKLSHTTFIQRLSTSGGAPLTGCALSIDVGKRALVPYTADYVFYQAIKHQ